MHPISASRLTPALSANLKPVAVILLAIRKKLAAMQLFTQLSQASLNAEDKHTFLELAKKEQYFNDLLGEYDPIALQKTLDELFASGRLTPEQYEKATSLLHAAEQRKEETRE